MLIRCLPLKTARALPIIFQHYARTKTTYQDSRQLRAVLYVFSATAQQIWRGARNQLPYLVRVHHAAATTWHVLRPFRTKGLVRAGYFDLDQLVATPGADMAFFFRHLLFGDDTQQTVLGHFNGGGLRAVIDTDQRQRQAAQNFVPAPKLPPALGLPLL